MITLTCRICGLQQETRELDLGAQLVSNRFRRDLAEPEYRQPLKLAQCQQCGLVQLDKSFPHHELQPRFAWMRYREREDHLAEALAEFQPFFTGLAGNDLAFGITNFDRVLFEALPKSLALTYTQLSPEQDLAISTATFGMETFQHQLTPERARRFAARHGRARLLISRYLFEHAENPLAMLGAYRELLADDGLLIVEVPDAEAPLLRREYQMIWEEHVSYFTENTLHSSLERHGFSICSIFKASSKFEQPLLALARKTSATPTPAAAPASELTRFAQYRDFYPERRQATQDFCHRQRESGREVVLFGAGHFTVAFVNFMARNQDLDVIIDDDPNKLGLILPGTSRPIVASDYLKRSGPVTILLCVNPDVEHRVREKLKVLIPDLESCYSIFAGGPRFYLHE